MELEYKDNSRRGRYIIILGVILALGAGAAAFVLINRAQQEAAVGPVQKVEVVVAVRTIPARQKITASDVAIQSLSADAAGPGVYEDPKAVIDHVPAVTILQGQTVTSNLLASSSEGGQFSILKPEESVAPDSPYWRAIAITVAPDLAVGGMVEPGMTVDVFLTATVTVPPDVAAEGRLFSDKSTKVVYQNIEILARTSDYYIIRAPLQQAEEIEHLQATAAVTFSLALRPPEDTRVADATKLGETTTLVISRYGLPVPQYYFSANGSTIAAGRDSGLPVPTVAPTASPSPGASANP